MILKQDLLKYERRFWAQGVKRLAGVDEAGRGPLAGAVVAAAVIFDPDFIEAESTGILQGLTDSKQLTAARRGEFFKLLSASAHVSIGIGVADVEEIDRINILQATFAAMSRAVAHLPEPPDHVIVDGNSTGHLSFPATAIVKGDARSLSIAAASVIAKVFRDRQLENFDRIYPQYGFARHKGYGTAEHMQALLEHGPCPIHRKSFRPVKDAMDILARAEEPVDRDRFSESREGWLDL
jgi:ribonuclease HII